MHIREAVIAPAVAVGELRVIHPEQVQDRRVKIMNVDFVFHHRRAQFIRRPVRHPALHARPGQP